MRNTLVILLFSMSVATAVAQSEDQPSTPEQRLFFAKQAAESYRFEFEKDRTSKITAVREPLLRWNNKIVREDDGMLFLWKEGDKGRPVAAAQFFLVGTNWHHEFQSLSPQSVNVRSDLSDGDNWSWNPKSSGIQFVDVADTDPPSTSAALRLSQMKSMAARYSAAVDAKEGGVSNPEELRLLATPIYRYSAPDQSIIDGAVFVFAQGTNPEILMLIEARGNQSPGQWQFGFARMSSYNLLVRRDNEVVWKTDRVSFPTANLAAPYHFRWEAHVDRSSEVKVPAANKNAN